MATRGKKKPSRRRRAARSLLDVVYVYSFTNILTKGLTGYSRWGFVVGEGDIAYSGEGGWE